MSSGLAVLVVLALGSVGLRQTDRLCRVALQLCFTFKASVQRPRREKSQNMAIQTSVYVLAYTQVCARPISTQAWLTMMPVLYKTVGLPAGKTDKWPALTLEHCKVFQKLQT